MGLILSVIFVLPAICELNRQGQKTI